MYKRQGIMYQFNDDEDLEKKIDYAIQNSNLVNIMRKNCIDKAKQYLPENAIADLVDILGSEK